MPTLSVHRCASVVFIYYRCTSVFLFFFFSSRRRHTRSDRDWSSDVCSSDLTSDTSADPGGVRGAWRRTDRGYTVTLGIAWPEWQRAHVGGRLRFDLLVNEMLPGRTRRAGQLVWSGGNGWVFIRGDRQEPERFGILELVG